MFFILFVLHDTDALNDVLTAWEECGVSGVTILPSTGLARMRNRRKALQEDIPLIPRLEDFLRHSENTNRTLFTIVESQALVDRVIAATEDVVGDLDLPNSGVLAVMPVAQVRGLGRRAKEQHEDISG